NRSPSAFEWSVHVGTRWWKIARRSALLTCTIRGSPGDVSHQFVSSQFHSRHGSCATCSPSRSFRFSIAPSAAWLIPPYFVRQGDPVPFVHLLGVPRVRRDAECAHALFRLYLPNGNLPALAVLGRCRLEDGRQPAPDPVLIVTEVAGLQPRRCHAALRNRLRI